MLRHRKALAVVAGVGLAATLATASAAYATLPGGTKVTGTLKTGTKLVFKGDIDSVPITVDCTSFSASAVMPKTASYSIDLSAPPTIKGCTDSTGGVDTIKTNQTNGKWTLSVTKTTPYKLTLGIPKAGATFTSSVVSGCTVTAAPTGTVDLTGSYNGTNTDTVSGAKIATKGTGCTSTTATATTTVVFAPSPGKPPF